MTRSTSAEIIGVNVSTVAPRSNKYKLSCTLYLYSTLLLLHVARGVTGFAQDAIFEHVQRREQLQCSAALNNWTSHRHKDVYRVGVLAIRGFPAAYKEFNSTFSDYLTATAGARFNPPIRFELKPLNFNLLFTDTEASEVDFIYVNPSAYSCIESQFGAHSLVSQISLRKVGGKRFDLTEFGGVVFAKADSGINTIQDIKGKSVACASISGLGSGQMQFRLLQQSGLSYINDPKQMVFTSNQGKVVNGVLNGEFDIGFVRTDQIERTKDANGKLVDASKLKVIEPKTGLNIGGVDFPFQSSTQLYAEWNVAALTHVSTDVAEEVQTAMLSLADHAAVGAEITQCYDNTNCESNVFQPNACEEACHTNVSLTDLRCDTTIQIALLAHRAKKEGRYTGWRTTLSYMDLRNMQEETGFINRNTITGEMQCIRSSTIYDAITCPSGHFKKSEDDVLNGCAALNMSCAENFQCVCQPCVKSFDVDVNVKDSFSSSGGCKKMENCGEAQQTKTIQYKVVDNKKRGDASIQIKVHEAQETADFPATRISNDINISHQYEFNVTGTKVGILILEILVNDEQIPESPLRVIIKARDCPFDTGNQYFEADDNGNCVCTVNAMIIGNNCVAFSTILPSVLVPILFIACIAIYLYVDKKRKQADSVWAVNTSELRFDNPPEVIGRGTFGYVLLAEYRGTQVAVKRVIPPRIKDKKIKKNDFLGVGESDEAQVKQHKGNSLTQIFDRRPASAQTSEQKLKFSGLKSGALSNSVLSTSSTQKSYRLKSLLFNSRGDNYRQLKDDFKVEMRHLSKLRHPCITTVMGAVIAKKKEPMLIMEYMDHGSLYDIIHNQTLEIKGEIVLPILRDIAQGVRFLHAAVPRVIHGDLKAQNILVDSKFRAKVADFGLSQKKKVGATGTPLWMAPELLRGECGNTAMSDVYSFGIILYEVYARKIPYFGEDHREVLRLVADPALNKRPLLPSSCPSAVVSIMNECVEKTPESRPTFKELDLQLKALDVENVEPGEMKFSMQDKKLKQAVRSEELLFDIFPKHIAEAIRDGNKVNPEAREVVTIFFSDIVGFTSISSRLTPMQVSDMLDRLYTRFDELSRIHDVFKVETIGDAYMAVTNLVKDQVDHAKRIARFSIDALSAANETLIIKNEPSHGYVNIRVGFHSGPVVANVVGTRNPRYCLFGDVVNTASRMESYSMANRIQCSNRSYSYLRRQDPHLLVKPRGKISIKGKGDMRTYWINEKPELNHMYSEATIGEDQRSRSNMSSSQSHPALHPMLEEGYNDDP